MGKLNQPMKIAILGPGAIGCLVGSLLNKSKNEIFFIGKESTVSYINQNGINIKSSFYGNFKIHPISFSNSFEIFDIIFITVKSYELQNAIKLISKNIEKHTIIISLLNGYCFICFLIGFLIFLILSSI